MSTIEKARELGEALAQSPEYLSLCEAKARIDESDEIRTLVEDFIAKERHFSALTEQDEMSSEDASELSGEIETIRQQLDACALFTDFLKAQEEFTALIGAVNEEISKCIGPASEYNDLGDMLPEESE